MGTRGLVVVKYNKKYYSRYNHMDSYPSDLGSKVVDTLEETSQDSNMDREQMKEHILAVASDNLTEITKEEPETTHMITWIYLVDMDEEKITLSIKGGYYEPTYTLEELFEEFEEFEEDEPESDTEEDLDNDSRPYPGPYVEGSYREPYGPKWLVEFDKKNDEISEAEAKANKK